MTKQQKLNKYCFGLGTVGRDALYTLVSMYLAQHLKDVVGFTPAILAIIGVINIIIRVFDSVNDPFLGTLVDNTNTKWGKFKPWILLGMLTTGVLTVLLFHNFEMDDTTYVIVFTITYFLWSIAFTANDISYWSLMPAITKDPKEREGIAAVARICANVGMFAVVLLYTYVDDIFASLGVTNTRDAYFYFSIILVLLMWGFQLFTLFGVKEDRTSLEKQEHTSLKQMFGVLGKNDQLLWAGLSMALFMIGYCTTTSFGVDYFRYAYKDEDVYMVFAAVLAVAQLTALSIFPLFRKKFTRSQLFTGAMVAVCIAYLIFFFSFENLILIIIAGLILFFAQAFIQLLTLLFLADAIEYGEWKLGKRNESISFAVQPFVNQIGGAIGSSMLLFVGAITSLGTIGEKVTNIKDTITDTSEQKKLILELANTVPNGDIWIMKSVMMILPLICIVAAFIIYKKKFKIDEKMYAQICKDLEEKNK